SLGFRGSAVHSVRQVFLCPEGGTEGGGLSGRRGSRVVKSGKPAGGDVGQCFLLGDFLPERLYALGLTGVDRILTHTNRTVMLSLNRRVLRIHKGYGFAPDGVLKAIVRFLSPHVPRRLRQEAEREFLRFPVWAYSRSTEPSTRRERSRPGDGTLLERLKAMHQDLNIRHFGGSL